MVMVARIARSMPTSPVADRITRKKNVDSESHIPQKASGVRSQANLATIFLP